MSTLFNEVLLEFQRILLLLILKSLYSFYQKSIESFQREKELKDKIYELELSVVKLDERLNNKTIENESLLKKLGHLKENYQFEIDYQKKSFLEKQLADEKRIKVTLNEFNVLQWQNSTP